MIKCPSVDELTQRTMDLNNAILNLKIHFSSLDDKLHKRGSIRVYDVASELWIDVLDEEKDLFYCTTIEETLANAIEEDSKQKMLWFDSITGYTFMASEEDAKKFVHEIWSEADKEENTKKKLETKYSFLIDILDSKQFLTVGNITRMFDLKCDNEYDYYIGDKKLYRKWLSDIFEDCYNTILESESVSEICSAVANRDKIEKAMNKFDAENNV